MLNFKEILNNKEYDFLKTNPHLGKNIILLVVSGSYAYGTNTETSDLDIRGVAIDTFSDLVGVTNFEQYEDKNTDTVIYSFKKFIRLLADNNPNILEMLFVKNEHIIYADELGKKLIDNREKFLSQKTMYTFSGFARAQLNRIENALARDEIAISEEKRQEHINRSVTNAIKNFEIRYNMTENALNTYVDLDKDERYRIFIDFNLKHIKLSSLIEINEQLSNILRDYNKTIGAKNKRKDDAHLNKHMMHLVRLYYMACEILEDETLHTYREKEHDLLLDIKNGLYRNPNGSLKDEFSILLNKLENRLNEAKNKTKLPKIVDKDMINDFMFEIYKEASIIK